MKTTFYFDPEQVQDEDTEEGRRKYREWALREQGKCAWCGHIVYNFQDSVRLVSEHDPCKTLAIFHNKLSQWCYEENREEIHKRYKNK